ncbi:hypothetical protein UFOVP75_41 [uncultured Caudovirales phage]|uniref:Uncharacterized protein n=1 Tax=uncultured Caudovirales phage TaxID=2100421 RepID=A0A6J5KZW9_9CAUD|nr:hypothetical protein UFOVP75_41 [uncultured Caudovirales phage]
MSGIGMATQERIYGSVAIALTVAFLCSIFGVFGSDCQEGMLGTITDGVKLSRTRYIVVEQHQ